jgi:hypothetical protein
MSSIGSTSEELLSIFEPIINELSEEIQTVSSTQIALNRQLDSLLIQLNEIKSNPDLTLVLENKTKKLISLKRRLTLIQNIIQNANDRNRKLITNYSIVDK